MARGRQRGRVNSPKVTRECSTQTETFTNCWQPKVVVQRLNVNDSQVAELLAAETLMDGYSELSLQNSSISVQPRPMHISRTPTSYKYFVKPITNNQRANSTLDNLSAYADSGQEHNVDMSRRRTTGTHKSPAAVKPGPLSYKLKVLQHLSDDMSVPVMLNQPSSPCIDRRPSLNLETISEKSKENFTSLDLENDLDTEGLHRNPICTESSSNDSYLSSSENSEQFLTTDKTGDDASDLRNPNRMNTIEFHNSDMETESGSCFMEENDDKCSENDFNKHKKIVKIKVRTVHIHNMHNHFYKP